MLPSLSTGFVKILGLAGCLGLTILFISACIHTLNKRILIFFVIFLAIGGFLYAILQA